MKVNIYIITHLIHVYKVKHVMVI